jgi:hypothetical protein
MDEPDDFVSFLGELVGGKQLEGAAAGIAAKVIAAGSLDGLSRAQHATLVIAVKEWISQHFDGYAPGFVADGRSLPTPECTESGDEVPWCEVYVAGAMNGGRCSWCMQVHHKDKD